jgi:hypothetical protein
MKILATLAALALVIGLLGTGPAVAADDSKPKDDSKVKQGTEQVQSGAKQIGKGVEDTAKGVGKTVTSGAEKAGDKIKEAGEAAEPKAKTAWEKTREGATAFGHSVKTFFTRLFSSDSKNN